MCMAKKSFKTRVFFVLDPALENLHYDFMFYVYVLKMSNEQIYIGFTADLKKRLQEHNSGKSFTTSKYLPVCLIYYEAYNSRSDAKLRETMIKRYGSSWSHLKKRLKNGLK